MAGKTFILGGGVTGLAVGYVSGNTIFEAFPNGGGICSSYYLGRQSHERTFIRTSKEEDYRFEIGGSHWIFGGDPAVLAFLRSLAPMDTHQRSSAVFFPNQVWMVPYPIQNHLSYLPDLIADKALQEIKTSLKKSSITLEEWLRNNFGETLF